MADNEGENPNFDELKPIDEDFEEAAPVEPEQPVEELPSSIFGELLPDLPTAEGGSSIVASFGEPIEGEIVGEYAEVENAEPSEVLAGEVLVDEVVGSEVLAGEVLTDEVLGSEVLTGEVVPSDVLTGEVVPSDVLTGEVVPSDVLAGEVVPLADEMLASGMLAEVAEGEWMKQYGKWMPTLELFAVIGIPAILLALAAVQVLCFSTAFYVISIGFVPYGIWKGWEHADVYTMILACALVAIVTAVYCLWFEMGRYHYDVKAREAKQRVSVSWAADAGFLAHTARPPIR